MYQAHKSILFDVGKTTVLQFKRKVRSLVLFYETVLSGVLQVHTLGLTCFMVCWAVPMLDLRLEEEELLSSAPAQGHLAMLSGKRHGI